jgi:hypothetical protein
MTLSIKTHEGTFPTLPDLGKALSVFSFDVPVPHMSVPRAPGDEDGDDDKPPRFIQEATVCSLLLFIDPYMRRKTNIPPF